MKFKIAIIGAGSIGFTRKLMQDILSVPEFSGVAFALTDINAQNLDLVTQLCRRTIEANHLPATLESSTDRREMLRGARYIINVTRIGGLDAFAHDIEIPLKYGVDQCVGDTLGAGGIMYGQRGIPVILDFCRDIREVAEPGAILLNYGNPNAMLTWAANTYGGVKTIGLCHGVQHGHEQIAKVLGLPEKEVDYICAGINHQTWYVKVTHKGIDQTGKLLAAFRAHPEYRETEKVRIDMLERFGYYSTESNGHLSEYVAWYRKRPEETASWISLSAWIHGETGGYLRVCREGRNWFDSEARNLLKETPQTLPLAERSKEHGSYILEALETGRTYRGHFNVINNHAIANLPPDCVVEVPGYVDRTGIHIPESGDLPLDCAAVCSASVQVQRLAVRAAVEGDVQLLKQAMLMDPLNGAVLTPPEVWQMTDELLVAEAGWLPQYADAMPAASERMAGKLLPYRPVTGLRVKEKTVDEVNEAIKNKKAVDEGALTN